jgi:hypothetical protein
MLPSLSFLRVRLPVLVALAVAAPLVLAPSPAQAATVKVPGAPVDGSTVGRPIIAATASFPAGLRYVTATVRASRYSSASASRLMLSVTLTCGKESITSTTNIMGSGTLTPRRVMTDAQQCHVRAVSGLGTRSSDALRVTTTIAAVGLRWASVGYTPTGYPTRLTPGKAYDAVPTTYTPADNIAYVQVKGDAKVTTCTSEGGSRENGSPNLCAGRVNKSGTKIRVSLVAQQFAPGGGYCATKTVASRLLHVNRDVHHQMIYHTGTYTISRSAACTGTVRIKVYIQVLSGADLIVHRGGTITALYR